MPKEENPKEKLKENFAKIQEKHDLPSFDKLNEDFGIEKIENVDSDFLIREVRKSVSEKLSNYLRFLEILLNPSGAPMFVYTVVKAIGNDEKKKLSEVYKELIKSEIMLIELDAEFSDKKEADFIKESYEMWQKMKKEILFVIDSVKKNWENKTENGSKKYFG
jgi:hypothetical protein